MGKWWDRKRREKRVRKGTFPSDERHSNCWCERHWAPYRGPNAEGITPNGLLAAVRIYEMFLQSTEYLELTDKSPRALNRFMAEATLPLCCRLGDKVMEEILADAMKLGTKKEVHNVIRDKS